jgi:hypothetical protein
VFAKALSENAVSYSNGLNSPKGKDYLIRKTKANRTHGRRMGAL